MPDHHDPWTQPPALQGAIDALNASNDPLPGEAVAPFALPQELPPWDLPPGSMAVDSTALTHEAERLALQPMERLPAGAQSVRHLPYHTPVDPNGRDGNMLHAFGPGDITCVAILPGKAYVLDEVTDFSVSSHFDKIPVRRLGHRLPVGWATGSGSIAGTLVCAQFTHGALWKLRQHAATVLLMRDEVARPDTNGNADINRARFNYYTAGILPQQLPPFHLMFVHTNQDGLMGIARLYNVVLTDHGEVKGAHNLFTEETLQFQALYYEQIRLHRSLTTEQMQALAHKPVAFFNDTRRPEGLVDTVLDVIATTGGDPHEFLIGEKQFLTEVEELEKQLKAGAASMSIADRGDVVWVTENDPVTGEPLPETDPLTGAPQTDAAPATSTPSAPDGAPPDVDLSAAVAIRDSYIEWDQTAGTNISTPVNAQLVLENGKLYLADPDADINVPTTDDPAVWYELKDVVFEETDRVKGTLPGPAYRSVLRTIAGETTPTAYTGANVDPGTVTFTWNTTSGVVVRDTLHAYAPATLTHEDPVLGWNGTYSARGAGFEEVYEVTDDGAGTLSMTGRIGNWVSTRAATALVVAGMTTPPVFQLELKGAAFEDGNNKVQTVTVTVVLRRSTSAVTAVRSRGVFQDTGQSTMEYYYYTSVAATASRNTALCQAHLPVHGVSATLEFPPYSDEATMPTEVAIVVRQDGQADRTVHELSKLETRANIRYLRRDYPIVSGLSLTRGTRLLRDGGILLSYRIDLNTTVAATREQGAATRTHATLAGTWRGYPIAITLDQTETEIYVGTIGTMALPAGTDLGTGVPFATDYWVSWAINRDGDDWTWDVSIPANKKEIQQ